MVGPDLLNFQAMKKQKHIGPFVLFLLLFAACSPVTKLIHSDDVIRWEQDMHVFDSLNSVENSDKNTLLLTGSSSIRLWDDIHDDLAPYEVMQRGYGGAKLTDFNYYSDLIKNYCDKNQDLYP